MRSSQAELVWQGRIQLGDEPGVFADAFYSGLCTELPITIQKVTASPSQVTKLILETENVNTFSGYPGHHITVVLYEEDPATPNHWKNRVLKTATLTSADHNRKEIELDFGAATSPHFISVRITVDTEVPAGLYDDFVVKRLTHKSAGFVFVASLGFNA